MSRRTLIVIAAALGILFVVGMCVGGEPAAQVDAALVREGPLEIVVATNGKVEPIEKAEVRARLDGRIVAILDPGVQVAQGGVLLRIDGGPVEAELATARSERLKAQDALRAARDRLVRVGKRAATDAMLLEKKALTPERNAESRAELKEAQALLAHLEHEVPLREKSLDHRISELEARRDASVVRAPFSGTVYRTDAKLGSTVVVGERVLYFANLDRLRVRANVDQVDLGRVVVGQPVRIESNAYPGRTWLARMAEVIPHVVQKDSRMVAEGLAEVEPPSEGLVPGMTVDLEVLVDASPRALQVPTEAVFSDPVGSFVYRLEDGRLQEVRVRVGRSTVSNLEILDGLEVGQTVVLGPLAGIEDGDTVNAKVRDDG